MRRDVVSDIKCKYVGWKGKTEEAETEENCLLVTTAYSLYCPEVINGPSLDLLISSLIRSMLYYRMFRVQESTTSYVNKFG